MSRDARKTAMTVSLAASVVMLFGKMTAFWITHSTAMLADAAESVVHGVATGFAAFSLWYASRPPDAEHPYGHGRIVYFSMGFEGALVLAAAVAVVFSGVDGLIHSRPMEHLGTGLLIAGGLALINLALGISLVIVGRRHNALVLVANGKHVLADFWTTAAAILGVSGVALTGIDWLDPVAALLIGGLIMVSGISLVRQSYLGLMDRVDSTTAEQLQAGLAAAVESGQITDFHKLRSRRINDEVFIDVHLLVDGDLSLADAHARVTQVEQSVRSMFPKDTVRFASHIEPDAHDDAHPDGDL